MSQADHTYPLAPQHASKYTERTWTRSAHRSPSPLVNADVRVPLYTLDHPSQWPPRYSSPRIPLSTRSTPTCRPKFSTVCILQVTLHTTGSLIKENFKRIATCITAATIFLEDNVLLERNDKLEDIKSRLWISGGSFGVGTCVRAFAPVDKGWEDIFVTSRWIEGSCTRFHLNTGSLCWRGFRPQTSAEGWRVDFNIGITVPEDNIEHIRNLIDLALSFSISSPPRLLSTSFCCST